MTYTQSCKQCKQEFVRQRPAVYCSNECRLTALHQLREANLNQKASSLPDRITAFYVAQAKGVAGYQVEKKRLRDLEQLEREKKSQSLKIEWYLRDRKRVMNTEIETYRMNMKKHPGLSFPEWLKLNDRYYEKGFLTSAGSFYAENLSVEQERQKLSDAGLIKLNLRRELEALVSSCS